MKETSFTGMLFLQLFFAIYVFDSNEEATQTLNNDKDNLLEAPTGGKKRGGQRGSMDIRMNRKNRTSYVQSTYTTAIK